MSMSTAPTTCGGRQSLTHVGMTRSVSHTARCSITNLRDSIRSFLGLLRCKQGVPLRCVGSDLKRSAFLPAV